MHARILPSSLFLLTLNSLCDLIQGNGFKLPLYHCSPHLSTALNARLFHTLRIMIMIDISKSTNSTPHLLSSNVLLPPLLHWSNAKFTFLFAQTTNLQANPLFPSFPIAELVHQQNGWFHFQSTLRNFWLLTTFISTLWLNSFRSHLSGWKSFLTCLHGSTLVPFWCPVTFSKHLLKLNTVSFLWPHHLLFFLHIHYSLAPWTLLFIFMEYF